MPTPSCRRTAQHSLATNEFTEVGTSGCGYVELTAGEMNYDRVHVVFKCTNSSAMAVSVHLYPEEAGDIRANVTQISGSTTAADKLEIGALLNVPFTVAGTPSATVFESHDVTDATADLYNGRFVIFRTGALANKATKITDYEKRLIKVVFVKIAGFGLYSLANGL